ncbi:methyltransferase domain-containing protein [Streptomyces sp. NPDC091204]|uniref:methyltransferase domain-containing protein n=1 Tax=Streptomyces sp. NPDC091204 TaxID=3155299 RepID=UPI003423E1F2
MTVIAHQERPSRTELGRCLMESGALSSDWAPAFAAVDRAAFLPQVMWPFIPAEQPGEAPHSRAVTVDRSTDPAAWYGYADSDLSVVTQWDDGAHRGDHPGTVPTSSSSQPSVVFRLLAALDADAGMRVLDAGTGTGETAALLAHRCGAANVTTIDVDPAVSAAAQERLCTLGLYAEVVTDDALAGRPDRGPCDRLLCTFGVRSIPRAWVERARPGGVIVAPYGTHLQQPAAAAPLTVHPDGTASGPFATAVEFMKPSRTARCGRTPSSTSRSGRARPERPCNPTSSPRRTTPAASPSRTSRTPPTPDPTALRLPGGTPSPIARGRPYGGRKSTGRASSTSKALGARGTP